MIVLGIDPGLASTGWGVIESKKNSIFLLDYGVIRTSSKDSLENRILFITEEITDIIQRFNPSSVSIEEIFFIKNISSAIPVAKVIGALMLTAKQRDLELKLFTPLQIKSAITGVGRAPKEQVERMVHFLLGQQSEIISNHASDALAAAICYIHTDQGNRGIPI
ncbi:MAG: crossover junction endodeoxyribonuclease RuvC [Spirochaetia bacterium]|nr:crossover junction endodeoxyribonuclease RuvC [Spirochaetia bacterium]MCF7946367.1 crossover junction endodeoxyribonuclease RuvC [Spirochaetia bacterium]